jgi:hypothetical protein
MAEDNETEDPLAESKKLAAQQLMKSETEAFVVASFNAKSDEMEVTVQADQIHKTTGTPMPQVLLSAIILDYADQTEWEPLRIGQGATYLAGQVHEDPDEFDMDFVTDMDEVIEDG